MNKVTVLMVVFIVLLDVEVVGAVDMRMVSKKMKAEYETAMVEAEGRRQTNF